MALCGRCWLCGHKFDCTTEDEAVRWRCATCNREHAICINCHDHLEHGTVEKAVIDLMALLANRRGPE